MEDVGCCGRCRRAGPPPQRQCLLENQPDAGRLPGHRSGNRRAGHRALPTCDRGRHARPHVAANRPGSCRPGPGNTSRRSGPCRPRPRERPGRAGTGDDPRTGTRRHRSDPGAQLGPVRVSEGPVPPVVGLRPGHLSPRPLIAVEPTMGLLPVEPIFECAQTFGRYDEEEVARGAVGAARQRLAAGVRCGKSVKAFWVLYSCGLSTAEAALTPSDLPRPSRCPKALPAPSTRSIARRRTPSRRRWERHFSSGRAPGGTPARGDLRVASHLAAPMEKSRICSGGATPSSSAIPLRLCRWTEMRRLPGSGRGKAVTVRARRRQGLGPGRDQTALSSRRPSSGFSSLQHPRHLRRRGAGGKARFVYQYDGAHKIRGGAGFRDDGIRRGYWVRCTCGWESGLCATPVLAEAGGEQHVELYSERPSRRAGN